MVHSHHYLLIPGVTFSQSLSAKFVLIVHLICGHTSLGDSKVVNYCLQLARYPDFYSLMHPQVA